MPGRASAALIGALALASCGGGGADRKDTAAAQAAAPEAVARSVAEQQETFAAAPAVQPPAKPSEATTLYAFEMAGLSTDRIPMTAFRGKVVLIVNTASQCGFTPQYKALQALYASERAAGLEILGVPSNDFGGQEPGSAAQIEKFCSQNYGVTFPMAAKTAVTGDDVHPVYAWAAANLGEAAIPRWNFHKILIGRDGRPIAAFPSAAAPDGPQIKAAVAAALKT
jgi:glutathione peroxidase